MKSAFASSCLPRLADAMFGDESDDDVKGEYTYKPKKKKARHNPADSDDDDGDDAVSDEDCLLSRRIMS